MGLVRLFKDHTNPDDAAFMGYRRHALCLRVFTGFVLVSSMDFASVRLIGVVSQFLDRHDPIPMIVVETIDGLDKIKDDDSTVLGGIPLLLQVNNNNNK